LPLRSFPKPPPRALPNQHPKQCPRQLPKQSPRQLPKPLPRLPTGHPLSGTPSQRKIKYKKSNTKYLEEIFGRFEVEIYFNLCIHLRRIENLKKYSNKNQEELNKCRNFQTIGKER